MKMIEPEVMAKITEIMKLKKELIQMIVPEQTYKHLEVIGNEVKAMVMETVCEGTKKSGQQTTVKKVNID